jgi:hypothetical protein
MIADGHLSSSSRLSRNRDGTEADAVGQFWGGRLARRKYVCVTFRMELATTQCKLDEPDPDAADRLRRAQGSHGQVLRSHAPPRHATEPTIAEETTLDLMDCQSPRRSRLLRCEQVACLPRATLPVTRLCCLFDRFLAWQWTKRRHGDA